MAEVTNNSTDQQQQGIPIDPSLIPEKFGGDFNKFVESYSQLEKRLSQNGSNTNDTQEQPTDSISTEAEQVSTPNVDGDGAEVSSNVEYTEALTSSLSTVELTPQQVSDEWNSDTGVSEGTKAKLNSLFGEDMVSAYFAGLDAQKSQAEQLPMTAQNAAIEAVGSDVWNVLVEFAGTPGVDKSLVDTYNSALDTGDVAVAKAVALALKSQYESKHGTIKSSSVTSSTPASGSNSLAPFKSNQEMMKAIQDPKYATDPAYRDEVAKRISKMEGIEYRG